jgi:hypothetical protein
MAPAAIETGLPLRVMVVDDHEVVRDLTSYADDDAMLASIMAGAAGYVLKQVLGGDLVSAVRTVGTGQNLLVSP